MVVISESLLGVVRPEQHEAIASDLIIKLESLTELTFHIYSVTGKGNTQGQSVIATSC